MKFFQYGMEKLIIIKLNGLSFKAPKEVLAYVLRSYGSDIKSDDSFINFKLVKDTNFLFSNPLCLLNTQYENGNVDSESGSIS